MPAPGYVNERRQKDASARDVVIAQKILGRPPLYQQLTRNQQRVLLKRLEMPGASWEQVAEAVGLSKSAAWARWRRAIAILPDDQPETSDPNLWNQAY